MQKSITLLILALLLFSSVVGVASAASVLRLSLDGLIERSDIVVYGRIVAGRCYWDPGTRTIWTETEVRVLDLPKGRSSGTVLITEPGGVIGDVGHLFPGVPRFGPDQEVVVFLYEAGGKRLRVTGLEQGVYQVVSDPATRMRFTHPSITQPELVYEDGRRPAAQTRRAPAPGVRLGDFLSSIRRKAVTR